MKKKFRVMIILISVIVVFLASGYTDKSLGAEDILFRAQKQVNSLHDCSYTIHTIYYATDEIQEADYEVMFKEPDMFLCVATLSDKQNKSVRLLDGELMWTYIPDTNIVTKTLISNTSESIQNDYVNMINIFINNSVSIKLVGEEDIGDRPAYLLEGLMAEKSDSSEQGARAMVWIDQDTWMLSRYEVYNLDGELSMELEIHDLEINTGISDSEFDFDVPTGARLLEI